MTKLLDEIRAVATGRVKAITTPLISTIEGMGEITLDYNLYSDCLEYKTGLNLEDIV